ncbi:hypothetical protein [Tritonibacter multivorans]|nr:hypothetical protein [Tritonibacter multivorans]
MTSLAEFLTRPLPGSPTPGWKCVAGVLLIALAVVWMYIPTSDD